MKESIIKRGLLGFLLGIAIGFIITEIISVCIGNGSFDPVTTQLIKAMENELNAVILQTVLCGVMGAGFAMASVIWEIDSWSLAKQSGIYFAIACVIMFPAAYVMNRMKHSIFGVLFYVGIFVLVFLIAWLFQYLTWKSRIREMNESLRLASMLIWIWRLMTANLGRQRSYTLGVPLCPDLI